MARRRARAASITKFSAVLLVLGLLVGACGGGDDDDASGGGDQTTDTKENSPEAASDPVPGGNLVYAIEAESDGLNPTTNRFAIAGVEMGRAVFDALTAFDVDGVAQPYLAESTTPNADYTEWTIKLRPNIKFHDGTPLTSEAIKVHFEGILADPLTSLVPKWIFASANPVTIVDDLTATVTMSGSVATFPAWLTAQFGYIASPTWLAAAKADPALNQQPVGTGPFKFESRDLNSQTTFVRNDDYWQEGLPYLDSVKFVIATDGQVRAQNLKAGDVDIIHTTRGEDIAAFREDDDIRLYEDEVNEETFLMMNMSEPPFDDVRVRKGLAQSTDQEVYRDLLNGGVGTIAGSIFHPDNIWSTGVDNFPEYDPAAGEALIAEYCTDVPDQCSDGKVKFQYKTTPSPDNDLAFQTFSDMWKDVAEISKTPVEQASFITEAAIGNYQMVLWRQFGALDPDYDATFIDQRSLGAISINWPRLDSDEIQALLLAQRAEPDMATRKEQWGQINELINEQVPYIYLLHTDWAVAASPKVQAVVDVTLPSGQTAYPVQEGRHNLAQIWIEQ